MIFKSTLFRRFLVPLFIFSVVPSVVIAWITLDRGRNEIYEQSLRQIQIAADGAEAQVREYLNYLRLQTSMSCSDGLVQSMLRKGYRMPGGKHKTLNRHLARKLSDFPECTESFIIDGQGRVIASSHEPHIGNDHSAADYYRAGQASPYISDITRDRETNRVSWFVSSPIIDKSGNKSLGVLVNRIDTATLNDIVTGRRALALGAKTQSMRIGETGEVYIVNRHTMMITESRFLEDAILNQVVDTKIVRLTMKGNETTMANYPDYRGIPVFGSSMIIEEMGWILIAEIDYSQAFIPVKKLRARILAGIGILIPAVFFVTGILSFSLTRPVLRLIRADNAVMEGGTIPEIIPLREIPRGEMGDLMRSRNTMIIKLNDSRRILEQQKTEIERDKEKYRLLIENIPLVVWTADQTGRITFISPMVEKICGYMPVELRGMNNPLLFERIHPGDIERVKTAYESLFEKNRVFDLEYRIQRKDESWIRVHNRATITYEKDGVKYADGVFSDCTEREQLEGELKKLNVILLSIRDINQTLLKVREDAVLFSKICDSLTNAGFIKFVWIGIIDRETLEVKPVAQKGFEDGFLSSIKLNLKDPSSHLDPVGMAIHTGEIIDMWDIEHDSIKEPWRDEAMKRGYASSVAVPLKHDGEVIGVLSVYSDKKYAFGDEEMGFLAEVGTDIAVGVKSLMMEKELKLSVGNLRKTLNGAIEAVAKMAEVKDPYTAGHQKRVALLSCAIAREIGLSDSQTEGIRISALLHDIGKIAVPSEILSKPGRLSGYEYEIVKTHVQTSHEVLKGLDFPWPVADIVFQHHERMDGSGYPARLKGDDIVIEARILALVDVVEAMSNHRPYRPALGVDKALEEISRNKGVLYDARVVDACLMLFKEKGFRFDIS